MFRVLPGILAFAMTLAGAGCRSASTPDVPDEAISSCLEGFLASREAPPDQRSVLLAQACKDLFAEENCRKAWANADRSPPDRRAADLVESCRAAYCPLLEEPRPELCSMKELPKASMLMPQWSELISRILQRDLGAKRAERMRNIARGLTSVFQVIEVAPPSSTP